jgi:hypothetical protein
MMDRMLSKMKICMVIAIGVILLNRVNAPLGDRISEKLRLDKDYTVGEIAEAVSSACTEAQAVMSQKLDGVFEEPYTGSDSTAVSQP